MADIKMPTDDLLSPASKVLSPVTRLDKAKQILDEQQKKRMAALSEKRIREVMTKGAARSLRLPARIPSLKMTNASVAAKSTPLDMSKTILAPRRIPTKLPSESAEAYTARVNAYELERSHELLRRLEDDDYRAKLRVKAEKEKLRPTSNYHLKHLGYAENDEINIYAPFDDASKADKRRPRVSMPQVSTSCVQLHESEPRRHPAHHRNGPSKVDDDDDVPRLIRRKPKASPTSSTKSAFKASPRVVSSSNSPRSGRATPMKARLRPRHVSSTVPLGEGLVPAIAALLLLGMVTAAAYYFVSMERLVAARGRVARVADALLSWLVTHFQDLPSYPLVVLVVCVLGLVLFSNRLSDADERIIERLVVCAKEELLLHATSNLKGHTAIPEAFLREAVLDLLGYKGAVRHHADGLWPSVRTILGKDSRLKCFQAKSKPGVLLWEWIAPQSETAMNRTMAKAKKHASPIDPEAKKLQSRIYIRNKQRMYRQEEKDEVNSLKEQIWRLEGQLIGQDRRRPVKAIPALSWQDISKALGEETTRSVLVHRALKQDVERGKALEATLREWAVSSGLPVTPRAHAVTFSIAHVPLLADPAARRLGFDWLTRIMYFNTERIFAQFHFPSIYSAETLNGDFIVDSTDMDNIQYLWRHQVDIHGAFEQVVAVVRDMRYLSSAGWYNGECVSVPLDQHMLEDGLTRTTYRRERRKTSPPTIGANLLYREFRSAKQCVIVGQSVPLDELIPRLPGRGYRKSMTWIALDKINENVTKMRILGQCGHKYNNGRYIPLEDEAREWDCDLTKVNEAAKEDKLRQDTRISGMEISLSTSQLVEEVRRHSRRCAPLT
ncbi:Aste57867_24877 [Aphanomyces stellatus]|uniref:Aste57867_24877 protein n=1 Tax=Aphanomyces stellatus TaxID=120398 RepID=A0A485LS85_9STRA|nr:hypothetical protein As57867_024799 [Aphanomyces stellatus]VFU01511.1 Aste57867_24877 [Aphanomyces stellatus]